MKMTDTAKVAAIWHAVGSRCRVLVVDDEPGVLATMEAILSETCDVTVAASGEEAMALLGTTSFDVVCTDHSLGGKLTGLDVIARVASLSEHVGRVLITGQRVIGDSVGYYVLVKPCEPQRMLDVIERAGAQAVARRKAALAAADVKRRTGDIVRATPVDPRKRGAFSALVDVSERRTPERGTGPDAVPPSKPKR